MKSKILPLLLLLFTAASPGLAQNVKTGFRTGIMPKAPVLDGVIQNAEWNGAIPIFGRAHV